jgi:hypothetical protein
MYVICMAQHQGHGLLKSRSIHSFPICLGYSRPTNRLCFFVLFVCLFVCLFEAEKHIIQAKFQISC